MKGVEKIKTKITNNITFWHLIHIYDMYTVYYVSIKEYIIPFMLGNWTIQLLTQAKKSTVFESGFYNGNILCLLVTYFVGVVLDLKFQDCKKSI